jgi:AraC-like DNA-binding protein
MYTINGHKYKKHVQEYKQMDLLDDIFKQADLKRRILIQRSIYETATLKFPCNKSMGFHAVIQGDAYLYSENGKDQIHLKKGDLIIMARGRDHFLSTEPNLSASELKKALHLEEADKVSSPNKKNSVAKVTVVSGAYQLWNEPIHPFFKELPDSFVLKNEEIDSFGQIQVALNMLSMETANPQIGSESIVQSLLDIIFNFLIRKIVETKSEKPKTWSHALQNESVKKAIELLHAEINRDWTLEDLAKSVGLSRAGLAQKFKKSLGDTPLHYLTLIRIQKAQALLSTTDDNIEKVAEAVGYSDAFSFSKVFKRITGVPPRDFRAKDQSDRALAYRF